MNLYFGRSVWVEIGHVVGDPWVFKSHVLGHGAFSAVAFFAVGDRADKFAFDLAGTSPYSFLLFFPRRVLMFFSLSDHFYQLVDFLEDCSELSIEDVVSKA